MIEQPPADSALPWCGGGEILLATLSELGLPRRLQNALKNRCSLIGQLIQMSEDELLRMPAMGAKTVRDAERILSRYSLELGTPLPQWSQAAAMKARDELGAELKGKLELEQVTNLGAVSEFLLATLDEAGLPQRLINHLPKHGCELVGHLVQWTEDRLSKLDNLGSGSISEAKALLQRYGLTFGMQLPEWDDVSALTRRESLLKQRRNEAVATTTPVVSPDVSDLILLATLDEIGLPKRFLNHLPTLGCGLVGQLIQKTEAELIRMRNLGRRSVKEARSTLAIYGLSFGLKVPDWNERNALARREALGDQIRQALFDARREDADSACDIEEEARQMFESVEKRDRNVDMLMSLLGFDGHPPKTLETVGRVHNLTRERVRQIGDRAQAGFCTKWRPTPQLDAALELLRELEPTGPAHFSEALRERGIARGTVHPEAIIELSQFAGKPVDVRRGVIGADEVYCSERSEKLIQHCARELRRATSAMGCTSLDRLAIVVGVPLQKTDRIKAILQLLSETIWLGESQNWAMSSRPTRNRIVNMAEKVFAVTERLTLPELRRCLSRSYRLAAVPAADALTALLELKGLAVSEGDSLRRQHEVSTECLGSIELAFFLAFQEHGSPLSREKLEDICIDEYGVHPTSFWIYLSYTPIVVKLAQGVYSLVGADVPAGAVETVRLHTKTNQTPSEHGWTKDGELWCVVQLDRSNIRTGSRALPAYVARLTDGDWACGVVGGLAAGTLTVENGFARGLAVALSLAGAENGDLARLTFDLRRRSVELRVGGSELADDASLGFGHLGELDDEAEFDVDNDPHDEA